MIYGVEWKHCRTYSRTEFYAMLNPKEQSDYIFSPGESIQLEVQHTQTGIAFHIEY